MENRRKRNAEIKKPTYHILNQLGRPARDRGLLDDDGAEAGMLDNDSRDGFKGSHIGGAPGAGTARLGRGVDGDDDDVGL